MRPTLLALGLLAAGCDPFLHDIVIPDRPVECRPELRPEGLVAEARYLAVRLTWEALESDADEIVVLRGATADDVMEVDRIDAAVISYTDDTVAAGTTYTYRLRASTLVGGEPCESTLSTAASAHASSAPTAEFGSTLVIDASCNLVMDATVDFDASVGAELDPDASSLSSAQTGAASFASDANDDSRVLMSAALSNQTPGTFQVTAVLADDRGGSDTLQRTVQLNSGDDVTRSARGRPSATLGDDAMSGRQTLVAGCGDCEGRLGSLAAAAGHTCVLTAPDAGVACFGQNDWNQLGSGDPGDLAYAPVEVCSGQGSDPCSDPLSGATMLRSSDTHSCVVKDGGVWCWGRNDRCQIGDGSAGPRPFPTPVCTAGSGAGCDRLAGVDEIAVGSSFTCARVDDAVFCWGHDQDGRLGDGTNGPESTGERRVAVPVCATGSVDGPQACVPLAGVSAIAAGSGHACAIVGVADEVVCWGNNGSGQLGDGTTADAHNPVGVCQSDVWNGSDCGSGARLAAVDEIDIGGGTFSGGFTCARVGGAVSCWGANSDAQLGNGDPAEVMQLHPMPVCESPWVNDTTPCAAPLDDATDIDAGVGHACAVVTGGGVRCWGDNFSGQLGDGTRSLARNPVSVCQGDTWDGDSCAGALTGVAQVSAGDEVTCVRLTDGEAQCFGERDDGQLGDGRTGVDGLGGSWRLYPAPVCESGSGASCPRLDGIDELAASGLFTCARLGGAVRCWGYDSSDQIGGYVNLETANPVAVCASGIGSSCVPAAGFVAVAAGAMNTCAVTQTGGVRCWGDNFWNQTGDGTVAEEDWVLTYSNPTAVCASGFGGTCVELEGVASVSVGGYADSFIYAHACAVTTSGNVLCWGSGSLGQLGTGFAGDETTDYWEGNPALVQCDAAQSDACAGGPLTRAVAVSAGGWHTCALRDDGSVWCWGDNRADQIEGVATLVATEARRMPIEDAIAIAAGHLHTCALLADTTVTCWGDNEQAQLGNGLLGGETPLGPVCDTGSASTCQAMSGAIAISAGGDVTCALMGDGAIRCWGWAGMGNSGDGTTGDFNYVWPNPSIACAEADGVDCDDAFVCDPLQDFVSVAVAPAHTCGMTETGSLRCFGAPGALGLGEALDDPLRCWPGPVCTPDGGACAGETPYVYEAAVQSCDMLLIEEVL